MKKTISKKENRDLILNGNLFKAIIFLAIPIIINSLLQTMYNLTDTYWLGKIGTDPMAAITIVTPIQNIIINFGQGLTAAGAILISQYIGARDDKNANIMANHIFICSILFSLICSFVFLLFSGFVISWLGAEGDIYSLSCIYLRIILIDMPFLFLINIYTAVNQAQGNTLKPMYLNFLGICINMVLDPLFLIVFKWGIAGAAFATLFSKFPCSIIAVASLLSKKNNIHISLKGFRLDKIKLKKIIKIGLPSAIGGSTMQFGFLLMSKNVLEYGSVAVAAYGIGNKVNGIITMPSTAMGSAVSTIVGQNIGADQYNRADKAYKLARSIIVLFLFISGIILSRNIISSSIVSIFSSDSEVIRLGSDFLSVMAISCWTNGIHNTSNGLFQGSGHTMITMLNDASRLWIFRFATLYICETVLNMGVRSIWYSVVVSNAISAFILWFLYILGIWKKDGLNIKSK